MRRTAWILAALGIAGSSLRGYAQEPPTRANVAVKRTAAAKAPVESESRAFYDELFGTEVPGEPESAAKPRAGSLKSSMSASQSMDELLGKGTTDAPEMAPASEAFPKRRDAASGKSAVSAAALFEAEGTVARLDGKRPVLKADAPSAVPEPGEVVPVAGTGKSVATSTTNRNQRIIPSEHTAAPTEVDTQQLLMIGELPVDPKAPSRPPKSTPRLENELPELDFSAATEEPEPKPAPSAAPVMETIDDLAPAAQPGAPLVRKRPAGVAPKFDPNEPAPNWEDEEGDAELLDNPFEKFATPAKPAPKAAPLVERLDEPKPAAGRLPRPKSLLDELPADEEPAAAAMAPAKRPTTKNPSTNPLRAPGGKSFTIPPIAQPEAQLPLASEPATDAEPSDIDLSQPIFKSPLAPPTKTPSRTVKPLAARPSTPASANLPLEESFAPPQKTAATSAAPAPALVDLPLEEPAFPPKGRPAAAPPVVRPAPMLAEPAPRNEYITSSAAKGSATGVTAEWVKKSEIAIGQECLCELVVKNRTDLPVRDVEVEAYFPTNVQLVGTTPSPARSQSSLVWKFDTLNSGETQTISIRMIPRERGNIATQAFVRFANSATGTFSVAEPMLAVELAGPNEVMIGETASHVVTIKNPGTGTASNVRVEARIPQGLEHSRGSRLMLDLGALNPGESRPVRLALAAVSGGRHVIEVKAHADGDIVQAAASEVMVVAPRLKASIQGPGLRYLGRRAVYTLSVMNEGSASTENVRVMHKIPEGFEYISSDKGSSYNAANRMLTWYVGSMNSGDTAQAHVTLEAKEAGSATHFIRATSEHGVVADAHVTTQVEGTAALVVEITDLNDPVEVGVETGYEIRVKNEGSAPAERVALTCELPAGTRFSSAAGAVAHQARGQMIEFRPVGRIAPGETVKFQVLVRGEAAGNLRFRTHLTSDSITDPLTSEELTKFYGE